MPILQQRPKEPSLLQNQRNAQREEYMLKQKQVTKSKQVEKQKIILTVYENQGHYFIDRDAAFSFKLTSVRPILTDVKELYEISEEQLREYEQNKEYDKGIDIEVQIQKTDKVVDRDPSQGDKLLEDELNGLEQGKYGIGVHGIDSRNRV